VPFDPGWNTLALLRLTLAEGVGPVLGRRLIESLATPDRAFEASRAELQAITGIGEVKAEQIARSLRASEALLEPEVELAERLGVRIIGLGSPGYPPLLAETPDSPLVLYVRGTIPSGREDYALAIVGSRRATAYGIEQAERFSAWLSQAGLVIVSGGAAGIDTASHRGALRVNGRTVAVLGCGLAHCYPPDNAELFERMVDGGGAIVSELPLSTSPGAENFPARNRIIAGLSLGVLVIEAPRRSGALITARQATEEYGREVMAVPGRIDSPASEGSNHLIRSGGAALVASPADVLDALESAARHHFDGTHAARFAPATEPDSSRPATEPAGLKRAPLNAIQQAILECLDRPRSLEEICGKSGLEAGEVQAQTLLLEVRRLVVRSGGMLERRSAALP